VSQSNEPPDPQPESTPGLDAGNSVQPGDTPPSEAGTSGLSAPEAKEPSRGANFAIAVSIVVLCVAGLLAFFVARLF
jgi:hypothetical protein